MPYNQTNNHNNSTIPELEDYQLTDEFRVLEKKFTNLMEGFDD